MAWPLLAADVPGCREIVRHEVNDLLFKVGSPQTIADAIERLIAVRPEQCRTWANNARAIAESEYDERLVIDAYRSEVIALSGKGR